MTEDFDPIIESGTPFDIVREAAERLLSVHELPIEKQKPHFKKWPEYGFDGIILAKWFKKMQAAFLCEECEHGVKDGEWCEPCNREYKRASIENELGE